MIIVKTKFHDRFDLLREKSHTAGIKALAKLGAFVRRSARSSIRSRAKGKPSTVGMPYAKGTGFLRESIVFSVNKVAGIVEIGSYRGGNVDEIHEFGLHAMRWNAHKKKMDRVKYPKRPVMGPALEKAKLDFARKFPEEFERYFNRSISAMIGG
jgi:hypothetical protein